MSKKIFLYVIIVSLIITSIYLYKESRDQKQHLKHLEVNLEEKKAKEQLIIKYKEDLSTIKELKQEILGQQAKLNEFNIQLTNFTETLVKNQEKLNKLEQ